jgi:hypothetical protein
VNSYETNPHAEVTGSVVLAMVHVMGAFRSLGLRILERHGIVDPQIDRWYRHQDFLNAVRAIVDEVGPSTLYLTGRQVAAQGELPPGLEVHAAMASLDAAYYSQHRGGEVGHYVYTDTGERSGTMLCSTPNPSDFDRGLLQALIERVAPDGLVDVHLDPISETRKTGGRSCTFLMSW